MEFITNNIEMIITLVTMVITWVLGALAKKSSYINNHLIILQNIIVGIIASVLYYIITKDFSSAIAMSGILAETGYNLVHNIEKLIEEAQVDKDNKTASQRRQILSKMSV